MAQPTVMTPYSYNSRRAGFLIFMGNLSVKRAGRPPPRVLYYSPYYTFFPAGWQGENPGIFIPPPSAPPVRRR